MLAIENRRNSLLRAVRRLHATAFVPLLRVALPTACFGCGEPLGSRQHLGACPMCWAGLGPPGGPICRACALPRSTATDLLGPARGLCSPCLLRPPPVAAVRAAVAYDDLARRFLLRAKLGRRRELMGPMASQLAAVARVSGICRGCSILVPVPSHSRNDLGRGFSPSGELARLLSRRTGLPRAGRLLVRRIFGPASAKRLRAAARARSAVRSFRVRGRVDDETVLLVDDVMTTGSSLHACACALLSAGAREVRGLVWARALPRSHFPDRN